MRRNSQRGLVDLVFMILMIVLVIGAGAAIFFTYDASQKEKTYISRLQQVPAQQQSQLDSTRARYAEVCQLIGFKGNADYSSEVAIKMALEFGAQDIVEYYTVDKGGAATREVNTVNVNGGSAGFDKEINGVEKAEKPVYKFNETSTIEKALGAQDMMINDLVSAAIPSLRSERMLHRKWRDEAIADAKVEGDKIDGELEIAIRGNSETRGESLEGVLEAASEEVKDAEVELGNALKEENSEYSKLGDEETRARTEEVFRKTRDIEKQRQEASRVQGNHRIKSGNRGKDDSRDPDGAIFQVDEESGWVWINIGKASDVRLNSTFQVLRADTSNSSEVAVGEIMVKQLLGNNMARCRVDNLDDPSVYPQQGDLIRNPNYSSRQYQIYALVGEFGGTYSKLTRQQIVDMLRGAGFTVVSKVNGATDALVIGGNWLEDPEFQKADEKRYNLEMLTVEDVLYFLGRSSD